MLTLLHPDFLIVVIIIVILGTRTDDLKYLAGLDIHCSRGVRQQVNLATLILTEAENV